MRGRNGGDWPRSGSRDRYADDLGVDGERSPDLGIGADRPPARPQQAPLFTPARGTPAASSASSGSQRAPTFGRGQRVRHADYGTGTVMVSSVIGSEELVLVQFDSRPDKPKNLSLSIHHLDPA
jgi:hypothetical protein